MPVGASWQAAGSGRAVAVARGSIAGRRRALRGVVHASGAALVFALGGAGLGHRAVTAIR